MPIIFHASCALYSYHAASLHAHKDMSGDARVMAWCSSACMVLAQTMMGTKIAVGSRKPYTKTNPLDCRRVLSSYDYMITCNT